MKTTDPAESIRNVIDVFLWFMAQRGWTLQRTRCNPEFRDLDTDVKACTAARRAKYMRGKCNETNL